MKKFIATISLLARFFIIASAQDCGCRQTLDLRMKFRSIENFDIVNAIRGLEQDPSPGCRASYHEWMAEALYAARSFDSAFFHLNQSLGIRKQITCTDKDLAGYHRMAALLNHNSGDYASALDHCLQWLPVTESSGDVYEEAFCLLLIGQNFNRMKESAKGIEYMRKALTLTRTIRVPLEKATLLNRISAGYLWRYQDSKDKRLLDTAEFITSESLSISREHGFNSTLKKGYSMMNGYSHERGDFKRALLYIDSGLALAAAAGDKAQLATNYGDKADVLMEMKNFKEARRFADSCLILHQMTGNPETIANAWALIYQISMESADYKGAVDAMNSYIVIQDSLTNAEKSRTIHELEQQYNKAKNEKTIRELAQQKRIYILLAVAGLFALLGLLFFIRQQSLRNKQKVLETEQRLNRARMNPHFFFNALSSLQAYALEGNDGKTIATNLSKFSHIMRETLESTYKEYVTIEQETDFLREYLELQLIRFPGKFTYTITTDPAIEPQDTLLPSMILQPFAENSIEHGFAGAGYPGQLAILFSRNGNELQVTIRDNGKGLSTEAREYTAHISRASQIIKDRIYLLNIKLKTKASFSIGNNEDGKGVTVTVRLPILFRDAVPMN